MMSTAKIELICFTDPYCSWCWATEPVLFRLQETYREQISMRYVMGGLVRDMAAFHDTHNDIKTTAEVMPHWRMVSERTGQPIDERLMGDITDPHFSTWPASLAIKAAHLQSEAIGAAYLRRMRRAALTERKYISVPEVYTALASEVATLDIEKFAASLADGSADQAFKDDLSECARNGATGFPTIMFKTGDQKLPANGYHSFASYNRAIHKLIAPLTAYTPRSIDTLLMIYGPLTTREVVEIYTDTDATVQDEIDAFVEEGRIDKQIVRGGEFLILKE